MKRDEMSVRAAAIADRMPDCQKTDPATLQQLLRSVGILWRLYVLKWLAAAKAASPQGKKALADLAAYCQSQRVKANASGLIETAGNAPSTLDGHETLLGLMAGIVERPPFGLLVAADVITTASTVQPTLLLAAGRVGGIHTGLLKTDWGPQVLQLNAAIGPELGACRNPKVAEDLSRITEVWGIALQLRPLPAKK